MADSPAPKPSNKATDRFSRLMFQPFPPRRAERQEETGENEVLPLPDIDWVKLFDQVGALTDSLQQLKPLMRKMTSLVDLFKK
ncbi:hypothetical protein [Geobacillus sp. C56-T2]|uniref:hypothetical protein n=1 Tax=Geobacillus sp. C56-T2 TaxID=600773 RepID=UPI0011A8DEF5|nr:hypothetical protein [Geobacillus sp. C56-T2]NNV07734.1 hypothetical protein [Geobacillus sp. MMMUD3]TWG29724.1 hypothetical protein GC56T2_0827 [Geobacillus sp. C56-T2]